jgi:hypothetical protein
MGNNELERLAYFKVFPKYYHRKIKIKLAVVAAL